MRDDWPPELPGQTRDDRARGSMPGEDGAAFRPWPFKGRVAVVSGGATGIGFAIARRLLADGARVAVFGHDRGKVERARHDLAIGPAAERVFAAAADVHDADAIACLFSDVEGAWGRLDILVNNAGISPKKRTEGPWVDAIALDEWRQVIEVNLTGTYICASLAARFMKARRYGRIISIASLAGRTIPLIAGPHYAASKAGIIGMTRALARDLAPFGITVNAVAPGRILTDLTGPADAETNVRALARIPLGRLGQPDDVGGIVAFLASDDAGFITGATVDVNGGEFAA